MEKKVELDVFFHNVPHVYVSDITRTFVRIGEANNNMSVWEGPNDNPNMFNSMNMCIKMVKKL